jgi:hypothetical protein
MSFNNWTSLECQTDKLHLSEPTSNPYCSDPTQCYCKCHDPHRPYIDLDLEERKTAGKPIQITKFANI